TASLSRYLNKKLGNVMVYFTNVNRTPSFVFDDRSSFYFPTTPSNLKKENIISFGATAQTPILSLGFRNTLITNHTYLSDYTQVAQYSTVMNLLQLTASTVLPVGRSFRLYLDGAFQQIDQAAPIRVPLLFARARFAFEKVLYKNLNLSTG
ncbi:putative porin, partial [Enterobacter hormaechei]|uniref:putative porin n=1 Tax=Enterobacter hormaechei TaxID=158836 RepID=UPI003754BFC2